MYVMNVYQQVASNFRNKELNPFQERMMAVLGIASESGEIAEAIKHAEFHGHPLDHDNLKKELGDLLWYLTFLCTHFGWSLEEIAQLNIAKLTKRYPKGFDPEMSKNRIENLPKILMWDRPGGVYGDGIRLVEVDKEGNILHARTPTEGEKIAIEMGHVPERLSTEVKLKSELAHLSPDKT